MTEQEIIGHLREIDRALNLRYRELSYGAQPWEQGWHCRGRKDSKESLNAIRAYLGIDAREME